MSNKKIKTDMEMAVMIVNALEALDSRKKDIKAFLTEKKQSARVNGLVDCSLDKLNAIDSELSQIDTLRSQLESYLPRFGYIDPINQRVGSYSEIHSRATELVRSQIKLIQEDLPAKINEEVFMDMATDIYAESKESNDEAWEELSIHKTGRYPAGVKISSKDMYMIRQALEKGINLSPEFLETMRKKKKSELLRLFLKGKDEFTLIDKDGEKRIDLERYKEIEKYLQMNGKQKQKLFDKLVAETEMRLYAEMGLSKRAVRNNAVTRSFAESTLKKVKPLVENKRNVRRRVSDMIADVFNITAVGIGEVTETIRRSFETAGYKRASERAEEILKNLDDDIDMSGR